MAKLMLILFLFFFFSALGWATKNTAYFDESKVYTGGVFNQNEPFLSSNQAKALFDTANKALSDTHRAPVCALRSEFIVQLAKRRYGVTGFKVWGMYWKDQHTPFGIEDIQRLVSVKGLGESEYHSAALLPVKLKDGRIEDLVFDTIYADAPISFQVWKTYFSQATGGCSPLKFMIMYPEKLTPGKRSPSLPNVDERFREALRILKIDRCEHAILQL